MKRIILSVAAMALMSSAVLYAYNGKKPVSAKKAETTCCKKSDCKKTTSCDKSACEAMPECAGH